MKNGSGYNDPTASRALGNVIREYKKNQRAEWQRRDEIKSRTRVYIVSRYAGNIEENTDAARRYCRFAVDKKKIPIASHLLYPQFLDDSNEAERDLGLLFGLALMKLCWEVWCFGEDKSPGMKQEIDEAKRLKKRIRYFTNELEEIK